MIICMIVDILALVDELAVDHGWFLILCSVKSKGNLPRLNVLDA